MPDATIGVVGRTAERAELEAFVDGVASGPATLELEAEAGMRVAITGGTGRYRGAGGEVTFIDNPAPQRDDVTFHFTTPR